MVDTPSLEARLRCLGTLLQQLNAQTACAAVNEAIERLATLSAPEASSDYVLVPREPTPEMVRASFRIDLSYMPGQESADRAAVYRAMIAAAPPTSGECVAAKVGPYRVTVAENAITISEGRKLVFSYDADEHKPTPADESGGFDDR